MTVNCYKGNNFFMILFGVAFMFLESPNGLYSVPNLLDVEKFFCLQSKLVM